MLRGLDTAIVDEADSVLIDEAVTPLIISGADEQASLDEAYKLIWTLADSLAPGIDYRTDLRYRDIELLPVGKEKIISPSGLFTAIHSARREAVFRYFSTALAR